MIATTAALIASAALSAQLSYRAGGCIQEAPEVGVSEDGAELRVGLFRPGMQLLEGGHSSCDLRLDVAVPAQRSFAVQRVTVRALTGLVSPAQESVVDLTGSFDHTALAGLGRIVAFGPEQGVFERSADVPAAAEVWSPCGGAHQVNLGIDLASSALLTVDTQTMRFEITYELAWKDCAE